MAVFKPFRAVRATRDKVSLVTTRSYEIYGKRELNYILEYNPYSFLHILRPGFRFKRKIKGPARFRMVRNRYTEFKENRILKQDDEAGFYLHEKTYRKQKFWGIIGLSSLQDYEDQVIKKHENTLKDREELFGNYLETVGFNAEPVLITHPKHEVLEAIYEKHKVLRPEYEFTTNKERGHKLWLIKDQEEIERIVKAFESFPAIYIADGHHRTASSHYLMDKLRASKNKGLQEKATYFMTYMIPEHQLDIASFFRFVKTLNGNSPEDFLLRLDESFRISKLGTEYYQPSRPHHFSMYLQGEFYKLYLRKSLYNFTNPLQELDSQILYDHVLNPILGIKDMGKDKNIHYLPERSNEFQMKSLVDSGQFQVAFGSHPISVNQLKAVADHQLVMPPKSTYIEPKLRSALCIYELK